MLIPQIRLSHRKVSLRVIKVGVIKRTSNVIAKKRVFVNDCIAVIAVRP